MKTALQHRGNRKSILFRTIAAALAGLLVLAYYFLPWQQESSGTSHNARGKQELLPGDRFTWRWSPEEGEASELALRLSGLKNAQRLTMTAELLDSTGAQAAIVTATGADLGEGEDLLLRGRFVAGKEYTLIVSAAGEGSVKLRGEDTEQGFFPQLTWRGSTLKRNLTLLYFALGCVLLALTPVGGADRRSREGKERAGVLLGWGTLFIVVIIGLLLVFLKPPFTEGYAWQLWDEEIHWTGVRSVLLAENADLSKALGNVSTWTPGYLPQILGASLAGLFTAQPEALYRAGALFSVLIYGLLAMTAVRRAPRYKAAFLVAAVLPANLFLASGMTYDTVVIGCVLLGAALLLEALSQREKLSAGQGITLLSVLALGTVAKPAYSVVLLLPLLLPSQKFESRARAWAFRVLSVLLLCWCVAAVALPGAYDPVRSGDSRYEGTDAAAQIAFLNANPLRWLGVPLGNLLQNWKFLLVEGIPHWAYLGTNVPLGFVFVALLLLLAPLAVCGERREETPLLSPGRRLLLFATALLAESALILTQFVVSSPVGGALRGMQARYFLPVWILLALSLMLPRRIRTALRRAGPWLALALWGTCLGLNLWYALHWLRATGCV